MPDAVAEVPVTYRDTWRNERVPRLLADVFRPAPRMSVSEWAEGRRVLTKGPMAGQTWRNDEAPYLVEIMDTLSNPHRPRKAVVIKGTRVGYTEGVIGNGVGYFIDQEPADVIVMQPTDDEASSYSKENLNPLLQSTPCLRARLHLDSYKDSKNTIAYKAYAGGSLSVIGPKGQALRRRSGRIAFSDEIDELEPAYEQGDPLLRLDKRLDDFDDAIHFRGSTPTIRGVSRIEAEYATSDRRRYFVMCPHCSESQPLEWGGKDREHGISWDKEAHCKGCGTEAEYGTPRCLSCDGEAFDVKHLPETAHYVCVNGCRIEEHEKRAMLQPEGGASWVATNPDGRYPGWHIPTFISLFAGARWSKLVEEFLEATAKAATGDFEALKVFVNTVLGETWEESAKRVDAGALEGRAEQWPSDVPDGVGVLVAAVDVQGDRLELLVRGFGLGEESWDILHQRIYGDPESGDTTWALLDGLLARSYKHANGGDMRIHVTMIDSGYATDAVYKFVKPREARGVYACKGDSGTEGTVPVHRPSRANQSGVKVFSLGVFGLKDQVLSRLKSTMLGPGYVHLRAPRADLCNGFDAEYFAQFGAEKIVTAIVKGSRRPRREFRRTRTRNEAIDLHAYSLAAFQSLGVGMRSVMPAWVEAAREAPPPEEEKPDPRPEPEQDGGSDWATGNGRWGGNW